ncbi:MAG: GGDEF domain-containing protein [Solirubrobacterales bacterium]|nr:GGDEF domain-containing protein [Solirubrobacterales bacterium]
MHPTHRGYRDVTHYRKNQIRYGLAFVAITAICFAATLISSPDTDWALYAAGWAVALASVGLALTHPALWLAAPFGALGGAILVRAGTDGLDEGIGPLLLIPVLAVAVYGSRKALVAVIVCVVAAVVVAQIATAEGEVGLNPVWRQDLVLAVMATVLGVVIQDLVTRMRRERNLAEERGRIIEELALTDPLTGIDNRRGWERAIQRSVGQARRHSQPLSLAMLDLDHFKKYNDAHGHQAGDDFLRRIALNWEEMTRIEDHIARYGGEEFVVTLPNTDLEGARVIVDRLRASLPQEPEGDSGRPITCSAGIAEWNGSETVRELVGRADQALYAAKDAGRDRTVVLETPESRAGFAG